MGWHEQGDGKLMLGVNVEQGRVRDTEGLSLKTCLRTLVDKYNMLVKYAIEEKFGYTVWMRPPCIVRWIPGCLQEPHADKQLNDGTPNPFPTYDINSVIYWNDDFEGGEFYYKDHNIDLKIEAGMAVAHPGDVHYLHGVKPITSGVRWTSPAFTTILDLGDE